MYSRLFKIGKSWLYKQPFPINYLAFVLNLEKRIWNGDKIESLWVKRSLFIETFIRRKIN